MIFGKTKHDVEYMIQTASQCKILPIKYLKRLCQRAKSTLKLQPNVLHISGPVRICGDIHGQFPDLLELFKLGGHVSENKYLFLGDYVDRGHYGIQTITYLLALKVKYPQNMFLLRGNHQSRITTKDYGFYDECLYKYTDIESYNMFIEVFNYLPLSAVVENKFICMHGGISDRISLISDIQKIDRFKEIPFEGLVTDLLWSDPSETNGISPNTDRGAGCYYGPDITRKFIYQNSLRCITRAHQVVMDGYQLSHDQRVITIFSAPNYCYRLGNKGAFLQLKPDLKGKIVVFSQASQKFTDQSHQKIVPHTFC